MLAKVSVDLVCDAGKAVRPRRTCPKLLSHAECQEHDVIAIARAFRLLTSRAVVVYHIGMRFFFHVQ